MTDEQTFALIRDRLFTAVIGDVMDKAGLTRQFLPPEIRALAPETVLIGRAMPVLEADLPPAAGEAARSGKAATGTREEARSGEAARSGKAATGTKKAEDFGLMFRALDDLKRNEVYVCTGASPLYALWGGLMSTRAASLGAVGAVVDGYHRDTREILSLGFPVFSAGAYAQDQRLRGKVTDFRTPITFKNGVHVKPGDVIVGDVDGVLAIPAEHLADIVDAALAKVDGEANVRRMILAGDRTEDVFNKTGIM